MYSNTLAVTALALLPSLISAQLEGSTVIDPAVPYDQIDSNILPALPAAAHTISAWSDQPDKANLIPSDCASMIRGEDKGYLLTDVEVFEVKYDDCASPWIMCRHKDATNTADNMASMFGRLPVRARSYVRHLASVPGPASAGTANDNILFRDNTDRFSIYAHETGHSLDSHAFPAFSGGFSPSQQWVAAYDADGKRVASDYSRSSQAENLAQMIVIALYDQNVDGGIAGIAPNIRDIGNQLDITNGEAGDLFKPGGECTERLDNSGVVDKNSAASSRVVRDSLLDVRHPPSIKIIKPAEYSFEDNWE